MQDKLQFSLYVWIIIDMDNQQISAIFQEISDMLDIKGENRFRVIAYSRAAQITRNLPFDLRDVVLQDVGKLTDIPGIGQDLANKIAEMVTGGKCEFHENLVKSFPPGLLNMLRLRTVGPKKVKLFYSQLGIKNIPELKKAAEKSLLQKLPKMGVKSEAEILEAIREFESTPHERRSLHEALREATKYVEYLKQCDDILKVEYAGSLRRRLETVGDIDILAAWKDEKTGKVLKNAEHAERAKKAKKISDYFVKYPQAAKILSQGETKSQVLLKSGIQVDLRVLPPEIFGAALHYFTGSKAHNIRIRDRAKKMGLKVSEYGVFEVRGVREKGEMLIAGKTEEEVFRAVGFSYIPPELREDRGEIEWAEKKKLFPPLIELEDLRGDLHCHSQWSDGSEPIEDVVRAYFQAGFSYMAITDHSKAVGIARGLTDEKAQKYFQEIERVQKKIDAENHAENGIPDKPEYHSFRILKGSEVDILKDGALDYSEKVLKQFDWLVASVHSHFRLPEEEQTKRVITAIQSGFVKVLGHPTGRMIHERQPIQLNMEAVIQACIDHHVALEINGSPPRMDLNDVHVKMAKDLGAKFVISTDSHHSSQREFLRYGIAIARRGWLTKENVLNTMPLDKMMKFFKK